MERTNLPVFNPIGYSRYLSTGTYAHRSMTNMGKVYKGIIIIPVYLHVIFSLLSSMSSNRICVDSRMVPISVKADLQVKLVKRYNNKP